MAAGRDLFGLHVSAALENDTYVADARAACLVQNLETARAVEAVVRHHGATPATIAIIGGVPHIGLTSAELELLASRCRLSYPALLSPEASSALPVCCMHQLQSAVHMACCESHADIKSAFRSIQVAFKPESFKNARDAAEKGFHCPV